jgi:hypothetical protein
MIDIEFGMITAPREKSTLIKSLSSFKDEFGEDITIFAEPSEYEFPSWAKVKMNEKTLGCFKNYHNALSSLISTTKKRLVCVLSDDIIYSKGALEILSEGMTKQQKKYAAYSLITPSQNIVKKPTNKGWIEIDPGWNGWGGLFVMPIETAKEIINTKFYINHLLHYKKNEQIDACMYSSFQELGLKSFVHDPSLGYHIGETSTLGHKHLKKENQGLNFII